MRLSHYMTHSKIYKLQIFHLASLLISDHSTRVELYLGWNLAFAITH